MIKADQPNCFPLDVVVAVSCRGDGTMLNKSIGVHNADTINNRQAFCKRVGGDYENTVYQRITYGPAETYDRIVRVDAEMTTHSIKEVAADALITTQLGIGLFLPVADCAATVLYDKKCRVLALLHLGRHSSYAKLAPKVVRQMVEIGSDPADITVWMSPHAQKQSYRLDWFDRADDPDWRGFYEQKSDGFYLDLAGFNARLLERAGIATANLYISPVDTVTDGNYFSHSSGETGGRIAILAMINKQLVY